MCKVYTGYCGTSEIEHGLCACTVDNPLAKARGLSLRTGAQPMLYLPLIALLIKIMIQFSVLFLWHTLLLRHTHLVLFLLFTIPAGARC